MASDKDNITFEKTSFLQGSNSPFIKDLYLKYLKNPESIPQSWEEFFDGLDEDQEIIRKEILGPSWAPKKNNTLTTIVKEKGVAEDKETVLPKLEANQSGKRIDDVMQLLIELRNRHRQQMDFASADLIRDKLKEIGITLKDSHDGTTWKE